jgi:hypothetical protein
MEYKLVTGDDRQIFENVINEYIQEGWEPIGGASLALSKVGMGAQVFVFSQALIRKTAAKD